MSILSDTVDFKFPNWWILGLANEQQLNQSRGRFYSEIIGLKWLISRKIDGNHNPLRDLEIC